MTPSPEARTGAEMRLGAGAALMAAISNCWAAARPAMAETKAKVFFILKQGSE
jgi:hypothetical protein